MSQVGSPPPPWAALPIVDKTGHANGPFREFLQRFWGGNSSSFGGIVQEVSNLYSNDGDVTVASDGVITVVKSEGRAFVTSAFTDTTNASNISTGILNAARLNLGSGLQNVGGAVAVSGTIPLTVGSLPAPAAGARGFVTDSTVAAATNFGAAVVGGGTFAVPVYSDGTGWFIG